MNEPNEFLKSQFTIDSGDMITMEGDSINGWLISSPSSVIISRMDLSKPLPLRPSQQRNSRRSNRIAKATQLPQLQNGTLNISNPGMTDDQGSSDSDGSLDDDYKYYASAEIWDSYWSSTGQSESTSHLSSRPLLRAQYSNLSQDNRNYASSNLSGLNSPAFPPDLHGLDAIRTSQAKQSRHTYSPFPAILPTPPPQPTHHSWPRRHDSRPNRPRAQTTPSKYPARPPSNLSNCTTLDYSPSSSGSTSPLYMYSSSLTPLFAPSFTDLPPTDFLHTSITEEEEEEVSHFDHDDDDDEVEEEGESRGERFKKMLHIRSSSNNHEEEEGGEGEKVKRRSLRRLRKSLSDVASDANETFRGVFRGKK